MSKKSKKKTLKLLTVIGLIGLGYLGGQFAPADIFDYDSYSIYARFESVAGLQSGYPVKMLGLKIGRVAGFQMDQDNQVAVAELVIKNDIQIYDDAIASIKMEGLIGENYVSIDPGSNGEILKSGEMIIDTESLIDIGELLSKYTFGDVTPKNNNASYQHYPHTQKHLAKASAQPSQ